MSVLLSPVPYHDESVGGVVGGREMGKDKEAKQQNNRHCKKEVRGFFCSVCVCVVFFFFSFFLGLLFGLLVAFVFLQIRCVRDV